MQTFLPYESFEKSAQTLDWRRLGKQRVEGMQIINAITGKTRKDGKPYKVWINHPCSVMWRDYAPALKHYTNVFIQEWINRGYNNNMEMYEVKNMELPYWIGDERVHSSHRANLLRKDKEYYSKFCWNENSESPYCWFDTEKEQWYLQHVRIADSLNYFIIII